MFKIIMVVQGRVIPMPKDFNLGLFEACERADLYAKRNRDAAFFVMNEENGDIEYETSMEG